MIWKPWKTKTDIRNDWASRTSSNVKGAWILISKYKLNGYTINTSVWAREHMDLETDYTLRSAHFNSIEEAQFFIDKLLVKIGHQILDDDKYLLML